MGWGASNSPNPWKHGSAKRVVRALDYGPIDVEEQKPVEAPLAAVAERASDEVAPADAGEPPLRAQACPSKACDPGVAVARPCLTSLFYALHRPPAPRPHSRAV